MANAQPEQQNPKLIQPERDGATVDDMAIETTETSENDNEPTEEDYIETIADSLNTIEKEIYNIFYTPKFKLKNFESVFETPPEYIWVLEISILHISNNYRLTN